MNIDVLEPKLKEDEISEGLLLESIVKYIKKSNFPKSIISKKLDLSEKNLNISLKETKILEDRGSKSVEQLMLKIQQLNDKCNKLLNKLRHDFSSI